jgi:hypothetical protein
MVKDSPRAAQLRSVLTMVWTKVMSACSIPAQSISTADPELTTLNSVFASDLAFRSVQSEPGSTFVANSAPILLISIVSDSDERDSIDFRLPQIDMLISL